MDNSKELTEMVKYWSEKSGSLVLTADEVSDILGFEDFLDNTTEEELQQIAVDSSKDLDEQG